MIKKSSLFIFLGLLISMTLMGCNLQKRINSDTNGSSPVSTAAVSPSDNNHVSTYVNPSPAAPVADSPQATQVTQPTEAKAVPTATTAGSTQVSKNPLPTQPPSPVAVSKSSQSADDLSKMLDNLTNNLNSTDTMTDVK